MNGLDIGHIKGFSTLDGLDGVDIGHVQRAEIGHFKGFLALDVLARNDRSSVRTAISSRSDGVGTPLPNICSPTFEARAFLYGQPLE